jgi:hypothetical protein
MKNKIATRNFLRYGVLSIFFAPGGIALGFKGVFVPAGAGVLISLGGIMGLIKNRNWIFIFDESPMLPAYWLLANLGSFLAFWLATFFTRWFLVELTGAVEETNRPKR